MTEDIIKPMDLSKDQYNYMLRLTPPHCQAKIDAFNQKMDQRIDRFLQKNLSSEQKEELNSQLSNVEPDVEPTSSKRQIICAFMKEQATDRQFNSFEKEIVEKEAKGLDKVLAKNSALSGADAPEGIKDKIFNYKPITNEIREKVEEIKKACGNNPQIYGNDPEFIKAVEDSVFNEIKPASNTLDMEVSMVREVPETGKRCELKGVAQTVTPLEKDDESAPTPEMRESVAHAYGKRRRAG